MIEMVEMRIKQMALTNTDKPLNTIVGIVFCCSMWALGVALSMTPPFNQPVATAKLFMAIGLPLVAMLTYFIQWNAWRRYHNKVAEYITWKRQTRHVQWEANPYSVETADRLRMPAEARTKVDVLKSRLPEATVVIHEFKPDPISEIIYTDPKTGDTMSAYLDAWNEGKMLV